MNYINLVPLQYKKALKRKRYVAFGVVVGILGIVGLSFLAFLPVYHIQIQQNEQIIVDQLLSNKKLEPVLTIMEAMEEIKLEQLNARLILDQIDITSHITRTNMDIIVDNAPKGLRINEVVIEGAENIMNIRGKASEINNIAIYVLALYQTDRFESIVYTTYHSQSVQTKGWVDYNLEIKLKSRTNEDGETL